MNRNLLLTFSLLWIIPLSLFANDEAINSLYSAQGVEGTLLIESMTGDVQYTNNSAKAAQAHIPASTFKIPNTLIALEEGAIKDQFEIIKWDGIEREYAAWNVDQTLASAFARSCVWCYQRFAKQIGEDRYLYYLAAFDYANKKTGGDVTTFWLEGDLRISPREQINFLRKVYLQQLPVSDRNLNILKEVMLVEQTPTYKLWAKTGWQGLDGWYVGYLEVGDEVWFFAHHMIINDQADLPLRRTLVMEALKLKGII